MRSTPNNNRYSSGRQKLKDIQAQSKNSPKSPSKSRRLSSAGCTPPPPPLHPSSSMDHDNNQRNRERRLDDNSECNNRLESNVDDDDRRRGGHSDSRNGPQFVTTAIRRNFVPRRTDRTSYFPFRVMGGLGIAQIFLGLLAVSMQLVALFVREPTSFIGAGIWAGMFFVVAGTLAVVSTRKKGGRGRVSWSISVMVVSIFAILVALGMLAVASIGLHLTSNFQYDTEYPLSWKVLESLLVVIALVEGLVAFLTSVMACKGIALNCRAPQPIGSGTESTALYMLVPKTDDCTGVEMPQSIEMRPVQVGADGRLDIGEETYRVTTLERRRMVVEEVTPEPPQRNHSYSLSRPSSMRHTHGNIILDGNDDFEPPPAYSERV